MGLQNELGELIKERLKSITKKDWSVSIVTVDDTTKYDCTCAETQQTISTDWILSSATTEKYLKTASIFYSQLVIGFWKSGIGKW